MALCHSELSEALEEYRDCNPMAYINKHLYSTHRMVEVPVPDTDTPMDKWPLDAKPEGVAVEMIDCIIRILDWMGHEGIDVDTLMEKKVRYNESREHRHGGKKA